MLGLEPEKMSDHELEFYTQKIIKELAKREKKHSKKKKDCKGCDVEEVALKQQLSGIQQVKS